MTPAAQVQATIEVLDAVLASCRADGAAAEMIFKAYARSRRYMGSKDRAAVRERLFAVLRQAPYAARLGSGRALMLHHVRHHAPQWRDLFAGDGYGPAAISPDEEAAVLAPGFWPPELLDRLALSDSQAAQAALQARAPLDVRVNIAHTDRDKAQTRLAAEGIATVPTPLSPWGLRAAVDAPIEQSAAFQDGWVEPQDDASQWVAALVAAKPGETVVDYCAGAGGKTLALAAMMQGSGRLLACDIEARRLAALVTRATRAGGNGIETHLLSDPLELIGQADAVLVDAPCSGSGTWRRQPEARLRWSPERTVRFVTLQGQILRSAARLVKPGGRLVYAVCSLDPCEGLDVIADFLASHPDFAVVHRQSLTPWQAGSDGFFVAVLAHSV